MRHESDSTRGTASTQQGRALHEQPLAHSAIPMHFHFQEIQKRKKIITPRRSRMFKKGRAAASFSRCLRASTAQPLTAQLRNSSTASSSSSLAHQLSSSRRACSVISLNSASWSIDQGNTHRGRTNSTTIAVVAGTKAPTFASCFSVVAKSGQAAMKNAHSQVAAMNSTQLLTTRHSTPCHWTHTNNTRPLYQTIGYFWSHTVRPFDCRACESGR